MSIKWQPEPSEVETGQGWLWDQIDSRLGDPSWRDMSTVITLGLYHDTIIEWGWPHLRNVSTDSVYVELGVLCSEYWMILLSKQV